MSEDGPARDAPESHPRGSVRKRRSRPKDNEGGIAESAGGGEERPYFCGWIKSFDPNKGYGFIESQDARATFDSDVFVHHKQLNDFAVGDFVKFQINVNAKGQPQAGGLCALDPPTSVDASASMHAACYTDDGDLVEESVSGFDPDVDTREFKGKIKNINLERNYGFIACRETFDHFKRDMFVPPTELNGFGVGDYIRFFVTWSEQGHPHACKLSARDPPPRAFADKRDSGHERAASTEEKAIVHRGTIKKIDGVKGFGFILCKELADRFSGDVYVAPRELNGFEEGDAVEFEIRMSSAGQAQAANLARAAAPDADAAAGEFKASGTIKSFAPDHGYGFISCPEVQEAYDRDVFLHMKQIRGFKPGDHVTFSVRINSLGHPQAYDLREAPRSVAWLAAGDCGSLQAPPGEEFVGVIKSFSAPKGYGFIDCARLHARFGRDTFIHQARFEGLAVGDRVTFRVQVKNGQPQASDVALSRSAPGRSGAGGGRPDGASHGRAAHGGVQAAPANLEELNRKLLRACASARVESVGAVQQALADGADANARDVTGQPPLVVSALNDRHSERKCRILVENRANVDAVYREPLTVLQWARQRINPKFAAYLEGLRDGRAVDYTVTLNIPADID